jgi:D-serine deaminase-like pyridoxal phosphate-dependent protein
MGYEGHLVAVADRAARDARTREAMAALVATALLLREAGLPCDVVSAGGTGTYDITGRIDGITEVQAGSYVTMDVAYRDIGIDFDCALSVLSTVTSAPASDRAVLDIGLKTLTNDQGMPEVKQAKGINLIKLSAEHGHLKVEKGHTPLHIGDKLEVLPSDTDTTINLHDRFYGIRNAEVEVTWPILARGKSK